MLALAVGRFLQLAMDTDSANRPFAVWGLPGATPTSAKIPLKTFAGAVPAWEMITGQQVLQLGKMDMLIWNGEHIWSESQFGLLLMDRFRTLWDPAMRCSTISHHPAQHLHVFLEALPWQRRFWLRLVSFHAALPLATCSHLCGRNTSSTTMEHVWTGSTLCGILL
jgi:hypothetical protein